VRGCEQGETIELENIHNAAIITTRGLGYVKQPLYSNTSKILELDDDGYQRALESVAGEWARHIDTIVNNRQLNLRQKSSAIVPLIKAAPMFAKAASLVGPTIE